MFKLPQVYRPNTRKMYEEHHGTKVPKGHDVHHILPLRLGGSHAVDNLAVLTCFDHAVAHLALFFAHGDPKDACAYYMISGRNEEAHREACAMGGRAGQANMKRRGDATGFQRLTKAQRVAVATAAGKIGGAKQRDLKLGFHAHTPERAKEVASMGGSASCDVNGWRTPAVQAANGRKGGPKNKGFFWYTDGHRQFKYTARMQATQSFTDFMADNPLFTRGRPRRQ